MKIVECKHVPKAFKRQISFQYHMSHKKGHVCSKKPLWGAAERGFDMRISIFRKFPAKYSLRLWSRWWWRRKIYMEHVFKVFRKVCIEFIKWGSQKGFTVSACQEELWLCKHDSAEFYSHMRRLCPVTCDVPECDDDISDDDISNHVFFSFKLKNIKFKFFCFPKLAKMKWWVLVTF